MDDQITEDMLLNAIRKRQLADIERRDSERIVNNIYGGGIGAGGVSGQMGGGGGGEFQDPADRDYFVDIVREDLPEINPDTGRPRGWKKRVHRFATGKKKVTGEEAE